MLLRKELILSIITFLLFTSCSDTKNTETFEGHWYTVGHDQVGYTDWKISKDNVVKLNPHSPYAIDRYQLIKQDTLYVLMPEDSVHKEVLGSIVKRKRDTVEFSGDTFDKLKMIRLTGKTNSPYNHQEYSEILANSMLNYELPRFGFETTIYLSDTTNKWGYKSADLIQMGTWSAAGLANSWDLENYEENYVFIYGVNSEVISIMIDEISEDSFMGKLFIFGEVIPVTVMRSDYPINQDNGSLESILTQTDWETMNTSLMDYEDEAIEEQVVRMEWAPNRIDNTIHIDSLKANPITFNFNRNYTLQTYKNGKPSIKYNWKISKDGNYIFIYNRNDSFAKLSTLKKNPPQLTLELGFEVGSPEEGVIAEIVVFELKAK